jgi:hypothetical protein
VLRFRAFCLVAFALITTNALAAEVRQARTDGAEFVGATGCQSSSCHGGAGEKRSQYITWLRHDFHTKAYAILGNARSARIAETVGGGEPATNARCTVCHAPFQTIAQTRFASAVRVDEGVSCESCHGAAGPWLRGHTRPDWTYATRVTAGMHDLRNLYVRANACVACHQNVDHDILQAGHPALVFELDSQSINQPKHWKDEDSTSGLRSWLTGQAVALREAAWHSRSDSDPAPDAQETSLALAWLLARVTLSDPNLPKVLEPDSSDLEPVQKQADELARRAPSWNANAESARTILRGLAETDSEFASGKIGPGESGRYRAKRLALALDRLTAALNQNEGAALKIEKELNGLREDVRAPDHFDPARFAEHLRAFRAKL